MVVKYGADHTPMANRENPRDVSLWHAYHISDRKGLWQHSPIFLIGNEKMKIQEIIKEANKKLKENEIEDPSFIARILLQFILQMDRTELMLKQTQEIEEKRIQEYKEAIQEIIEGKPLQYITKRQEFYGLDFYVDENVLIPQPDTEILVEEVLTIAKVKENPKLLDICTGSGAIGITLAANLEKAEITMSDISRNALEVAKKNAKENEVNEKVKLVQSNLFEKIQDNYFIIVSNPPYIETEVIKTLSKQVQQEPILALDGGKDGLDFYRKLIEEAPGYLEEGGYLCLEIGYNQKEAVLKLIQENGKYTHSYSKKDLAGNDRIIIGTIGDSP